jgi:tRNA(adenine34) deaminase
MEKLEHESYMDRALALAESASDCGEVPVGALVVHENKIIGTGYNQRESNQDPVAHAEIIAIREAASRLGSWRLENTTLYVTLEPCPMCAGAILNARIPLVVYGCDDPKAGAVRTLFTLLEDKRLNHRCQVVSGVRADEAAELLRAFFHKLRKTGPSAVNE